MIVFIHLENTKSQSPTLHALLICDVTRTPTIKVTLHLSSEMWNCLVIFIVSTCVRDVFAVRKLQIVHTNDMHARYLEVDENTVTCTPAQAKENKCYGGFARIRQAAIEAREEATREHIPSIFLNAGDTFQGTPYYSTYKWEITAPLVDAMEFDAMVMKFD